MLAYSPRWGHKLATLAQPTGWVKGFTLRRIPAWVRFLPANPSTGLRVQLLDGSLQPYGRIIPVSLKTVRAGRYDSMLGTLPMGWSEVADAHFGVGVCEHILGACVIAGLTDTLIQVHYPERVEPPFVPVPLRRGPRVASMPLFEGNAMPYLSAIGHVGGVICHGRTDALTAPKVWFATTPFGPSSMRVMPRHKPGWKLVLTQDNPPEHVAPWWKGQATKLELESTSYGVTDQLQAIAHARPTNSSMGKFWLYRLLSAGTDQDGGFAVVQTTNGPRLKGQRAYALDEAINHRALDVCGDLIAPLGAFQADIHIHYASHAAMGYFRQRLLEDNVFV